MAPSHSPAQLIQLGQTQLVGVVYHERVGVGNVQSRFHDHSGDEDGYLAGHKIVHHPLQCFCRHLSVRYRHLGARRQRPYPGTDGIDSLDPVVHHEHLPPAVQFTRQRLLDEPVIPRLDERQNGRPVARGGFDQGDIPKPRQRQMQGTRDRRGGEGQHVDRQPESLQPFLVPHPKPVLFIHDQQAKILEHHVFRQQSVRTDHHIDFPRRHLGDDRLLLLRRTEPRQHLHSHREIRQPLTEGPPVLVGQDRGRYQHGDLLASLDRLEGRPYRDLGLAVAHITHQEPVHRARLFHVPLDLLRCLALIGGILVQEARFQFLLPPRVGRKSIARRHSPLGVQLQQLGCHLLDRRLGLVPGALPTGAAQLVEFGGRPVAVLPGATISFQLIQPVERHVQPVTTDILQHRHLEGAATQRDGIDTAVDTNTVIQVHHVVALLERPGSGGRRRLTVTSGPPQPTGPAEDLVVGEHPEGGHDEAAVQRTEGQGGAYLAAATVAQQFVEPFELSFVVTQDQRGRGAAQQPAKPREIAVDAFRREESALQVDDGSVVANPESREGVQLRPPH